MQCGTIVSVMTKSDVLQLFFYFWFITLLSEVGMALVLEAEADQGLFFHILSILLYISLFYIY